MFCDACFLKFMMNLVYFLESILGMNSVSLKDLKKKKLKQAYFSSICVFYLIEFCVFTYGLVLNGFKNILVSAHQCYGFFALTVSFAWAAYTEKSKVAAELNLGALESLVNALNHKTEKTFSNSKLYICVFPIVFSTAGEIWVNMFYYKTLFHGQEYSKYITLLHYYLMQLVQCLGCYLLLEKLMRIQHSVNRSYVKLARNFIEIEEKCVCPESEIFYRSFSSYTWIKNLETLKKTQGTLSFVENQINSFSWVYLNRFIIVAAAFIPLRICQVVLSTVQEESSIVLMVPPLRPIVYILAIVWVAHRIQYENKSFHMKLIPIFFNLQNEGQRRNVKHQLLGKIHRTSPFHCFFFRVDFSLLMDIMDSSSMIIITLLSK